MTDWTAGYVTDIGYTYGYYPELNPLRLRLAFAYAGLRAPEVATACELGFGQGVSIGIHAAASNVEWTGNDFIASQAAFARRLGEASGCGARLSDESFAELCSRTDLPDFDYIGLQGVWSWVSEENRAIITDFIRRKLKPGGVVYMGYNTQPGWAAMVPMRDLLLEHTRVAGAPGQGTASRIDSALAFAEKLFAVNPRYLKANPRMAERLEELKNDRRNYLAHEYFNRDWHPMPFSRVAEYMGQAKLGFGCSAYYIDHIDPLTPDQRALVNDIPDAMFRETVRDFCINQRFRRDYWIKGPDRLNRLAQADALRMQRLVLVQPADSVSLEVIGSQGSASLHEGVCRQILDVLSDHQPRTLGQIEHALRGKGIAYDSILQVAMAFVHNGAFAPAQEDAVIERVAARTARLNAHLCEEARGSMNILHLASPVTGGGIVVPPLSKLFLLARSKGKQRPADRARFVWDILAAQGQRMLKDGRTLEGDADNLAELTVQAQRFLDRELPVLQALRIA